tara:strand:- start:9 stop:266 length:258 start_codon:yes stop_codon:yes gene_type:complete
MKLKMFLLVCSVVVLLGAAIAAEKKVNHSEKYKIETFRFGDMIDINFLPNKGWKWNEEFPAELRFSICNETECYMITEKIKIKKD